MLPVRLRDFIEDPDGWLYAVSTYDNTEKIGCVLRYVPEENGERVSPAGRRYRKYDFEEAYAKIAREKPAYAGLVQRIPRGDVRRVLKPDEEIERIAVASPRVKKLLDLLSLPRGTVGCTGSLLCGLANESSDIDMVVYGRHWFGAQDLVKKGIQSGKIEGMSPALWRKVYDKRKPEISYDAFVIHEQRKWNRGQIDGTYFDILYTRSYDTLAGAPSGKGEVLGRTTIEATVTDASLAFDNPAVYLVDHDEITKVLSFTHTYSGQALRGEIIEACGVVEQHGPERWLIVGTTREARGEYIISKTLIEQ
ncbi:nucleotidyltransferase domain-containing protein [Methanoregula sp. UBA64]|uniref:nucleotidyltransferase domain-containing protein n=1 Tax=Methanoregula sp. UBA64 TaxID=1915554 RepID=UPI0025DA911A|nr:nucleotidyltransferase domain-containing protein [Methanoregula sp. UBA64]